MGAEQVTVQLLRLFGCPLLFLHAGLKLLKLSLGLCLQVEISGFQCDMGVEQVAVQLLRLFGGMLLKLHPGLKLVKLSL